MKYVWVDEGNDAWYDGLKKLGADPCYSPRDPRVTAAYLDMVAAKGFKPRLYFAWNWYGLDGPGFARKVDSELRRIAWPGNAGVCLDIEVHDPAYISGCFDTWRSLRPTRATDWTLESYQGGWASAVSGSIAGWNINVAPSSYRGDMTNLDPASVMLNLVNAGFPADRLVGMYDAKSQLLEGWNGYAFTQGRLVIP